MTPKDLHDWTLPIAIAAAAIAGVAMISLTVRTSWIRKSITWAIVSFGFLGATLLLSPKWERFLVQWGELKAEIASLEKQNSELQREKESLVSQIRLVSSLSNSDFASAEELVSKIESTRNSVDWAKFLPADDSQYAISVKPGSTRFLDLLNTQPGFDAKKFGEILQDNNLTLVETAIKSDLQTASPDDLWVMPASSVMKAGENR